MVPQEVVEWAMRKLFVRTGLVRVVMSVYVGSRTSVKVNRLQNTKFEVKVGVNQESVLSFCFSCGQYHVNFEVIHACDLVLLTAIEGQYGDQRTKSKSGEDKCTVLISSEGEGPLHG